MNAQPFDAAGHLRAELSRLLRSLAELLRAQRARGRTSLGDAVGGLVVEDGEAEGLLAGLARVWADRSRAPDVERPPWREGVAGRAEIAERAQTAARQGASLPLLVATRAFRLEPVELDALLLALAVELDARFGRLVAYLNDHLQRTRPTLGLAAALAALDGLSSPAPYEILERPSVRKGLLLLEGEGPSPGIGVRLSPDLVAHFASGRERDPAPVQVHPPDPGLLARLVLGEGARARGVAWARRLRSGGDTPPLLVVGLRGSGRGTFARAVASEAGWATVSLTVPADRPEAALQLARRELAFVGASAALFLELTGDHAELASSLRQHEGPLLLATTPANVDRFVALLAREPLVVPIDELGPGRRAELWKALLPPGDTLDEASVATLAARFRFPVATMARSIRRAKAEMALAAGEDGNSLAASLERACREIGSESMGSLAQKLPLPYRREDLVAPPHIERELDLALAWIRHQRKVLDDWGFSRRVALGRGLTALFAGEPGTGKTMAVQVLARELGVDAFRVDLSRVMSKYIGETEKNLGALFDEASASGAMLFFDEADALFGKRSKVTDAHDRYANVEVGYLLQRMEEHDGITVLATNRQRDLDEAFLRRFHVIVDFPMPLEADRLRIWRGMIPAEMETEELDLAQLAREYETSGGEIKNAALAAAFLAAAEGRSVTTEHLRDAIRRELLKSGKAIDERKR